MGVTTSGTAISPRAQALADGLKEARESAGLSLRALAKLVGWRDHTRIVKYEGGDRRATVEDAATLLQACGVGGERREEILALARDPNDRSPWVAVGMSEQQRQLARLLKYESTATAIVTVSPLLVPGLLQTSGYVRAIMRTAGVDDDEIEMRVAARLGRREMLVREEPADLTAVIGEAALLQQIGGPAVMLEQLRHLLNMAERQNIHLRVLPIVSPWTPAHEGPFILVESTVERPVVHIEGRWSGLFLHEQPDLDAYRTGVEQTLPATLSEADSVERIAAVAQEIERMG